MDDNGPVENTFLNRVRHNHAIDKQEYPTVETWHVECAMAAVIEDTVWPYTDDPVRPKATLLWDDVEDICLSAEADGIHLMFRGEDILALPWKLVKRDKA